MKEIFCLCCLLTILTTPLTATPNPEIQAALAVHDAWELAFERADINTVEKLWLHDDDVLLVTPLRTQHKGFAEIKGALKNVFALLGQTTLDISDPFLINDDELPLESGGGRRPSLNGTLSKGQ